MKKNIERYTVGELIAALNDYDPNLPVGVLTFDEDDQGDGPTFTLRPELFGAPAGSSVRWYLGIAGYFPQSDEEGE